MNTASAQQRAEIHKRIWSIADALRGKIDGNDFKQYVLCTMFYRFISENFAFHIDKNNPDKNPDAHYVNMQDSDIPDEAKKTIIKEKGYFIYPSQLFANVVKTANTNQNLNNDLQNIFDKIESSSIGYTSECDIKGLFADFNTKDNRLGQKVSERNKRFAAILNGIAAMDFGDFDDHDIDIFGDAYEFIISNYSANAGKSGGEFFTPQHVSKLLVQLSLHNKKSVNKIYDPTCGSGSLLLQAKKCFGDRISEDGYFGQESEMTTYNLARMNMFLHNVNYNKFSIKCGDTLINPQFQDDKPFDAIVSNPPYSSHWIGKDDPTLINDDRFAPAGALAPKSNADFAFILHSLSYLSSKGRAAIVCFPGIFYRGGAEQKIRKYLVDQNFIESIIALPPNMFYGTNIAVMIMVLAKNKDITSIQFIDASGNAFYKKEGIKNIMEDHHIKDIIDIFDKKENIPHVAQSVSYEQIVDNNYNLSVKTYVETEDTSEIIDIKKLNADLKTKAIQIDQLRSEINTIIAQLES